MFVSLFLCWSATEYKPAHKHSEVKCPITHTDIHIHGYWWLWEQLISYITNALVLLGQEHQLNPSRSAMRPPAGLNSVRPSLPCLSARDQNTDTCRLVPYCACVRFVTAFGNTRCRIMRLLHIFLQCWQWKAEAEWQTEAPKTEWILEAVTLLFFSFFDSLDAFHPDILYLYQTHLVAAECFKIYTILSSLESAGNVEILLYS